MSQGSTMQLDLIRKRAIADQRRKYDASLVGLAVERAIEEEVLNFLFDMETAKRNRNFS